MYPSEAISAEVLAAAGIDTVVPESTTPETAPKPEPTQADKDIAYFDAQEKAYAAKLDVERPGGSHNWGIQTGQLGDIVADMRLTRQNDPLVFTAQVAALKRVALGDEGGRLAPAVTRILDMERHSAGLAANERYQKEKAEDPESTMRANNQEPYVMADNQDALSRSINQLLPSNAQAIIELMESEASNF